MLGICIVYLAPDKDAAFLLKMNLAHLIANTDGQYKIYGVGLRLADDLTHELQESGVVLPQIAEFTPAEYADNAKGVGEHSHYLDQLVDVAFRDGCSHVTTFDMDSWPIAKGWNSYYYRFLTPGIPVIAIQRVETKDNFPNPAFTMMHKSAWRLQESSFAIFNPRCTYKLEGLGLSRTQSGAGILAELRRNTKRFFPLLRTNRWNPHPVMCGIYDQRIFHFGAGSRQPTFAGDDDEYELTDAEISRAYVLRVNGAKRAFFLNRLGSSSTEFINELAYGEIVNRVKRP